MNDPALLRTYRLNEFRATLKNPKYLAYSPAEKEAFYNRLVAQGHISRQDINTILNEEIWAQLRANSMASLLVANPLLAPNPSVVTKAPAPNNPLVAAPITVADFDKIQGKKKRATKPQVLKIARPFVPGDVVFADQNRLPARNDTLVFGIVDHVTPTGRLAIHILNKRVGNAVPVSGDETSRTEVFPTNQREIPRRTITTDINGENNAQVLIFELYDPNKHYYDITRESYD